MLVDAGGYRPHALRLELATPPPHELGPILRRLRTALDAIAPSPRRTAHGTGGK